MKVRRRLTIERRRLFVLAAAWLLLIPGFSAAEQPGAWTDWVEVRYENTLCVSYRAQVAGDLLLVQARHEPKWHTFALDNKLRAEEKLAGKRALSMDQPTDITVSGGLRVAGPWYQSPPKDFSKPELRWFAFGFEEQSVFAAKVRRAGPGPGNITIRGQACSENLCKQIDLTLSLPVPASLKPSRTPAVDLATLVLARTSAGSAGGPPAGHQPPASKQ